MSYFLWSLENTLHFYLFVGFGFYALLVSGCFQIKLLKLNEKVQKICFFCKCSDRCVVLAFLSLFNPSLLTFFLTPFPYMVIILCKQSLKQVCFVWLIFCSTAVYGGVSYYLWTLGNTLHFYLFVGFALGSFCMAGVLQIECLKLHKKAKNIRKYVVFTFLLLFNPSLIFIFIFFLTPIPYMIVCCVNNDSEKVRDYIITVWLVLGSIGLFAGVWYYLWTLDDTTPRSFYPVPAAISLIGSGYLQLKYFSDTLTWLFRFV